jgi:mono/diheme cytochrome c family protein
MKSAVLLLFVPLALMAQGNTDNGKKLYEKDGCYQCHGWAGLGGLAGPRLAQTRHTLQSFTAFVRNPPSGGMPPFREKILSAQEMADIYAFVKSIPEPKPAKDIPLLNQ